MNEKNKENIKNAFFVLLKSCIPLFTTFLGVVLANVFNVEPISTTAVSAVIGNGIYKAIC